MSEENVASERREILSDVVKKLLTDLTAGAGEKERRRQVEEWLRTLAEKYPEFQIESGLRDYYLAEAKRLKEEFEAATEITDKLVLGRSIESFLDRATEYARRAAER